MPISAELDAAVLRQAALGDVELRHDLDARDDRGLQPARRRLDVVQHAVDAVADLELVLERLDVDVGRALLDGAVDEHVHQPDDRRLARQVAEVVDVLLVVARGTRARPSAGSAPLAAAAAVAAVAASSASSDVPLAREPRLDLEAGRDLEALDACSSRPGSAMATVERAVVLARAAAPWRAAGT